MRNYWLEMVSLINNWLNNIRATLINRNDEKTSHNPKNETIQSLVQSLWLRCYHECHAAVRMIAPARRIRKTIKNKDIKGLPSHWLQVCCNIFGASVRIGSQYKSCQTNHDRERLRSAPLWLVVLEFYTYPGSKHGLLSSSVKNSTNTLVTTHSCHHELLIFLVEHDCSTISSHYQTIN